MPEFNELGGGALGLNEALGRILGMEKLGPAPTLAPEISPSIDLGRLPDEWAGPAGYKIFLFGAIASAVAGELSYSGISNPAGSNVLVVVEAFMLEGAGTYTLRFRVTDTPTVDAGVIPRDLRWPAAQVGTSHFISGAEAAATGAAMARFSTPAAATAMPAWTACRVVLAPGTNVVIEHGTVNTAFTNNWLWWERRLRAEELSFQ